MKCYTAAFPPGILVELSEFSKKTPKYVILWAFFSRFGLFIQLSLRFRICGILASPFFTQNRLRKIFFIFFFLCVKQIASFLFKGQFTTNSHSSLLYQIILVSKIWNRMLRIVQANKVVLNVYFFYMKYSEFSGRDSKGEERRRGTTSWCLLLNLDLCVLGIMTEDININ